MCGILGVRRSFCDDPDRIDAAVAAMAWRGPDGSHVVQAGDWHVAVARLVITDPAHGQPLWSADRARLIAFNGTVASAVRERELVATATGNDAELPLHRLQESGERGLAATSGHYALAILEPESDRLWLARDPEGEKPLYVVRRDGDVVAFASTLASLRALGLRLEFAAAEMARFVRFGFDFGPRVIDPGYELTCDPRDVLRCADGRVDVVSPARGEASGRSLRDVILEAVARHASAEVPVGLSLSGGIDSSCLAAALSARDQRVKAYQFCATGADRAERELATAVAAHTGQELIAVDGGPEILRVLPELTRLVGRPLGDPSVLAVHALARRAAADGVRVLLGGEGADELFFGYRRHRAARHLAWVPSWWGGRRDGLSMSTFARLRRALRGDGGYESLLEVAPPEFRSAVFTPAFTDGVLPDVAAADELSRAQRIDRHYYLRYDLLPKLDTALMAAGIEGRCPYLDPDVVATAEQLARNPRAALGKRALRGAFGASLPRAVFAARKRGFAIPLDRWLREDDYLADILRDRSTRERSFVRAAGLTAMLDAHRSGRADLGHALYLVAAVELHLRDVQEPS